MAKSKKSSTYGYIKSKRSKRSKCTVNNKRRRCCKAGAYKKKSWHAHTN